MPVDLHASKKHSTLLIVLLLSTMILAVYWPMQDYEFTNYDDQFYVLNNTNIQSGFTAKSIAYAFTDISTSNWHPITMLSHMLDWSIYGNKAGGHHWTSVIIHILNAVLLFLFFQTITGALWRSAFIAALFAIHPINVDSVAWIAERKSVLSTFFWITALLFYVRYAKAPGWKRYLPVFFSFALGLMTKPMVVTLPFVLLLLDYWPLNRTQINSRNEDQTETAAAAVKKEKIPFLILEKIPLFVLSAISIVVTLYAAKAFHTVVPLDMIPFDKRVANAVVSYGLYIKKMFWPVDLAVLYPFNYHIPLGHIILAALFIVAITALTCRYYRKFPYLPVGWFWYLGTLVPVIGLVQVGIQSMADRYAYIPFIGLFLMLIWGMSGVLTKMISTKVAAVASVGILAALMILAHNQLQCWENSYTLYQNAIKVAAPYYLPHKNLALYFINQKRPQEAVDQLLIAISLKKNDPTLHNSLGVALNMLGKEQEAEKEYKTALQLHPTHTRAHNNLGVLLFHQNRVDEAIKHLREAIRLEPDSANAHFYLAKSLKQKGLDKEAAFHYETAMRLNPDFKDLQ